MEKEGQASRGWQIIKVTFQNIRIKKNIYFSFFLVSVKGITSDICKRMRKAEQPLVELQLWSD